METPPHCVEVRPGPYPITEARHRISRYHHPAQRPRAFRRAVDALVHPYGGTHRSGRGYRGAGLYSWRGGRAPAFVRLCPIRKKGKTTTYDGIDCLRPSQEAQSTDEMEIVTMSMPSSRATPGLLVDDLIATGDSLRGGEPAASDWRWSGGGLLRHRPTGDRRRSEAPRDLDVPVRNLNGIRRPLSGSEPYGAWNWSDRRGSGKRIQSLSGPIVSTSTRPALPVGQPLPAKKRLMRALRRQAGGKSSPRSFTDQVQRSSPGAASGRVR